MAGTVVSAGYKQLEKNSVMPANAEYPANDEISLSELFAAVQRRWRLILVVTAVATAIGLFYAVFTQPVYVASTVVQAQMDSSSAAVPSELRGAAALAGISIDAGGSQKATYLAVLKSSDLALRFIDDADILPLLFPERWDSEAKAWKSIESLGWKARLGRNLSAFLADISKDEGKRPQNLVPTNWEILKRFEDIRTVEEDALSGLITVSIRFRDPVRATAWANSYVALADELLRAETIQESTRALEYLNKEGQAATVISVRQTIFDVVENHISKRTLARVREEFAFRVIDRATVPSNPDSPRRMLSIFISLMLGLVVGIFLSLIYEISNLSVRRNHSVGRTLDS